MATPTCDICRHDLVSPQSRNYGRCAACRDVTDAGGTPDEARAKTDQLAAEYQSAKIDGRPWWEAGRALFISAYPDLDALNTEAPFAAAAGYTIASMSATDGHTNLGRAALGFWVAGPLGAAVVHSRTEGAVIVAWRKS